MPGSIPASSSASAAAAPSEEPPRRRRFLRHAFLAVGGGLVAVFLLTALLAPLLAPYPPDRVSRRAKDDLLHAFEGPSLGHPFGRDQEGRDVLSRVIYGTRVSLQVGLVVVGISASLGVLMGLVVGYRGGWTDELFMRLVDVLLAFPGILLAIAIIALLGAGLDRVIFALCLTGWVGYARLVRGQVLVERELDYVLAARALGASSARVLLRHILPNILAPVTVQATFGMAGAILGEASLSFLGLGVQPPTPSFGGMLNEGANFLVLPQALHLTLFPGLGILLVVLGFNLLGDGLRDALDPRSSGRYG